MSATIDTWIGRLGLLAGALVVAAWLAATGSPADAPAPTSTIRVGALANGELELSPLEKPVLAGNDLRAGGPATTGTLRLRNITPNALSFAMRTTAARRELDRSAWIEIRDGDDTLLNATLGHARQWTGKDLALASGETRKLDVRIWIPKDAPDGWQAGRSELMLELASRPEQAR